MSSLPKMELALSYEGDSSDLRNRSPQKPSLSHRETIDCQIEVQREYYRLLGEWIKSGLYSKIKASGDAKLINDHFRAIKYRGIDKLFEERGVSSEQLTYATAYYQSEREPEVESFITTKALEIQRLKR